MVDEQHLTAEDGRALVRSAPRWLRNLGVTSWLLVGVTLLLVGTVWLLALTQTIVLPVITAGVVAAVGSPVVGWLARHRVPRGAGAALLLLALAAVAVGIVVVVVGGITSQADTLKTHLASAEHTIQDWLNDLGIDAKSADQATNDAHDSANAAGKTLLHGVTSGIVALSSLGFFLALTALSLFFMLKDGPVIRSWLERHMTVPTPVAQIITGNILRSLRGYFFGVTIVAAFNACVVGGGALLLGVPQAGTIAVITFVGAYVPYLGAWAAGSFAVVIALGGVGTDAALGMIVIQLLANGLLQQLVQPIAYGAALGIHPLAVLVVTIAGGSLFGAAGLILAAPAVSAVTRIMVEIDAQRRGQEDGPPSSAPGAVPSPAG
jgi:putative heme transporter